MTLVTQTRTDNNHRTVPAPTTPSRDIIALQDVTFHYTPANPLIENLNWQIGEGEAWGILGPSGCGKTTLLYLLAGLRQPVTGEVCFRGEPLTGPNHDVGLMLQDYGLLPWMNAERNVQIGLKIRGVPRRERHRIRQEWLQRMEIGQVAKSYPARMSGGQRQRVALARVLALQTAVLLLDEPLAAVDEFTRERLQKTLWKIRNELQSTMVLVTHSVEEAALLADNILIFPENGPLRQPEILRSPFAADDMPTRADPTFQRFCADIRETLKL